MAIQQKSLREQVRDEILARIASRRLHPGERIGGAKLAMELGVSYVPVREALHELVGAGVLESESNKGVKVGVVDSEELISAIEIRAFVEMLAVRRAALSMRGRGGELQRLARASVAVSAGGVTKIPGRVAPFHVTLIDAAGDRVLKRVWESVQSMMLCGMAGDGGVSAFKLRPSASRQEAIAKAIDQGEPERAGELVRQHYAPLIEHLKHMAATRRRESS